MEFMNPQLRRHQFCIFTEFLFLLNKHKQQKKHKPQTNYVIFIGKVSHRGEMLSMHFPSSVFLYSFPFSPFRSFFLFFFVIPLLQHTHKKNKFLTPIIQHFYFKILLINYYYTKQNNLNLKKNYE